MMSKSGEDGAEVLTIKQTVEVKAFLSGERSKLKKLAKEKLEQSGWTDDLRQLCRDHAARCSPVDLTHEGLVTEIGEQGKSRVPDYLKAELLAEIRQLLES